MQRVFISIGSINIYWYSIILLVAFTLGLFLALKEAQKWNIKKEFMYNYFFYLVPIVLIGARIYYVIFNFDYYSTDILSILKVWEGGLAIHGGIITGIIFTYFYTKKYSINMFRITDIGVVSLILGQAIGRWGNFFNQEAHGTITTLSSLKNLHLPKFIIDGMYIDGNYYIPTFFYESILCLIGFVGLLFLRKIKNIKLGQLTGIYLIWYAIVRFVIESYRTDSLMLGSLKMAQIISILMFVIGIIMIIINKNNKKYNES